MVIDLHQHRLSTPIPAIYLIRDYITEDEESYLTRKIDQVGNSNQVVQPDGTIFIRAGGWQNVNGRRSMYWGGTLSPKGKLLPQNPPGFMTNEWPYVFDRLGRLGIAQFESSSQDSDSNLPIFKPNHCLVNEYHPGDGILPHTDGPAYVPTVATLSLESNTVYEFYCYSDQFSSLSSRIKQLSNVDERLEADRAEGEDGQLSHSQSTPLNQGRTIAPCPLFSLFVPRRSLIIITSECYKTLLHSIPNRSFDDVGLHLKPCLNWSDHEVPSSDLIDGQLARDRRLSLTCRRVEKVMKGLGSFLK